MTHAYPSPDPHGQWQPPHTPKKTRKWPWVAAGAVALLVIIVVASNSQTSTSQAASASPTTSYQYTGPLVSPTYTAAPVAPPAPVAAPEPAGPATTVSDGTYEVGPDMVAGRYKTPGPDGSSALDMCYWSRNKNDSGEFGSIIANDIVKGPGSVTVKNGEFVEFSGGCTWTKQ